MCYACLRASRLKRVFLGLGNPRLGFGGRGSTLEHVDDSQGSLQAHLRKCAETAVTDMIDDNTLYHELDKVLHKTSMV